jgi:hypothetical protein
MLARFAGLIAAVVVILLGSASALMTQNAPPGKPAAAVPQAETMPKMNPAVGRALGTLVKAKADMSVSGAYACCIKPGCNFCALAADKCPCRSNVKTPAGVCGECKAGWEAGVGAVEGVQPQNVQQIKGDMLKMMYSMREPRERMASGQNGHQH